MGFCSDKEYIEFLQTTPDFERMLIGSGIILLKYWFSDSTIYQSVEIKSYGR